jgi:adenine-specific DNA-methyltransferase
MPTLNWIGKEKVINHHLDVPFRTLKSEYAFGDGEAAKDNLIIHGDNLEALKALLPRYEGKVKVVCIDPPYNTGNESWVYNDNVNDPKIKKWLGQVVGKEGEDLSRHDKWLCMMYPRLKLLHRLMKDDGVFFAFLDDNEQSSMKLVLDEIFGKSNFITTVIWQKVFSPKNTARHFSEDHDYVLVYAKNADYWTPNLLPRSDDQAATYKNPDNDPRGPWTSGDLAARNFYGEGTYSITSPAGRVIQGPPPGSYWRVSQDKLHQMIADNRIWWGADGLGVPRVKRFLSEVKQGVVPQTLWFYKDVGHTQDAKKELLSILDFEKSEDVFITPKPTKIIERILQIASDPDSIILDSFAGSGTTAHAVLKLNQADGGNRRFIMIEMEDYAETITAERVRRVIAGYGPEEKKVAGTGGGFSYLTLGPAVFSADGKLNPDVEDEALREYLWYAETKTALPKAKKNHPHCLGSCRGISYYFFYKKGEETTLDYAFLKTITEKDDQYVIYADACSLDGEYLKSRGIQFKKIPRDIPRY